MFGLTTFAQSPFAGLGGNVYSASISESVTPADFQSALIDYVVSVIESSAISDSITYTVDTTGIVTGVLLTISITSPNIWGKINDNQSPNWVKVNNASSNSWTQIDNNQSPDWVDIKN